MEMTESVFFPSHNRLLPDFSMSFRKPSGPLIHFSPADTEPL
jgi:hypothetical protein